jgi:hypothetical protein
MEIAYAVTRDKDLTKLYSQLFSSKLADALWADASEDTEDDIPTDANGLIGVRY